MKKIYQSPQMEVMREEQTQMLCGSMNSTFGFSTDKIEKGSEEDWSDTDLGW